ncbi:ATP-binding cassette subfamily B protein [Kineothrix alysoides]|uniref:ATP-binding cassette subfamily B protein n=1 Tax=Kineothrix alysoides TaxID=1469948 RepID=A0A4R1QR36_9FIRM|nr:ABC transporter ATP-binding protein [Kineothrix alysoides]TCL55383.1 ATP-binding cassette subfamily B protein [Kineothrix alysoides]
MPDKKKLPRLQDALMLTDKGYKDLKKAIAACTFTNFSMMLPTIVMLEVIMELIKPFTGDEISWNRLWILFAFGIAAAFIVFLCSKNDYKKTYIVSYMESENARTSMAEHIRKLPMSVFNSKDISELTTNLMGDVATTEHVLSHIYPQLFSNAITITVICIMIGFFDWRMGIAIFISVPIAFLIILGSRGVQRKLGKRHADAKLAASEQVQEYIEGLKVIKACNMDGERFGTLEKALRTMRNLAIKFEFGTGIFITGAQVVLQAGVGLTVFVGITLLTGRQIELIPLLMCLLIVTRIYGPIQTELTLLPELLYHQIAIKRMRALMNISPMEGAETPLKEFDIDFKNVNFSYNAGGGETIKDVSVSIQSGGITALVGPSGSGKSTLSRLIARFWDVDGGSITIGGVNVKTLDPEHLMAYMSIVFQDVVLFNDTIYNNIRIGNMNATREQVIAAAKAARCDEFADKLPDGYDTLLGENGSTLSGGERQRLSIARALLKDAPIVLLDEATASLDPESESYIQQAISKLIENKTVIVIAHRLRTIVDADKIIVMNEGEVVEQGTHQELLGKEGLYNKLYSIQQESLGWSI